MRRQRAGVAGESGPNMVGLRLAIVWLLGALLAGPLGAATPAMATSRVAATPVQVAKAAAGAAQAAGRLTYRGGQANAPNGRAALATAVEALWSAQGCPQGPGMPGVPVAGPSLGGLALVVASTRAPARVAPAATPAAVRGRAPPGGGTSAVAGLSFPLPA